MSSTVHLYWCLGTALCIWKCLIIGYMCFAPAYGRPKDSEESHAEQICGDMKLGVFQAPNGAYCCLCAEAEFLFQDCGLSYNGQPASRICATCPFDPLNPANQTYMDMQNNRTECFKALDKDACEKFQNTLRKPGNKTSNARCVCKDNHIPGNSDVEGGCFLRNCREGFQPTSDGKECKVCHDGFFSNVTSPTAKCLPWTNCGSRKVLKNGTTKSDVQCENDVPSSNLANPVYNTTHTPATHHQKNVTFSTEMENFWNHEGLTTGQKVAIGICVPLCVIIIIFICKRWEKIKSRFQGQNGNRGEKVCFIAGQISFPFRENRSEEHANGNAVQRSERERSKSTQSAQSRSTSEGRNKESDNAAQKSKEKRSKSTQNDLQHLANSRDELAPGPSGKNKKKNSELKSEQKSTPETENAMPMEDDPTPSVPDAEKNSDEKLVSADEAKTKGVSETVLKSSVPSGLPEPGEASLFVVDEDKTTKPGGKINCTDEMEPEKTPSKVEDIPSGVAKLDEPSSSVADKEKKGTSENENDEVYETEPEEVWETVHEQNPAKDEAVPFGVPDANGAPVSFDMTHLQCLTQQERRAIEDLGVAVEHVRRQLIDPQLAKDILYLLAKKYDTVILLELFRLLGLTDTNIKDINREHPKEEYEIRRSMIRKVALTRGNDLTLQLIFMQDFYKELRDFAFEEFVSKLDACHGN